MSKQPNRKGTSTTKKIHQHWYSKITGEDSNYWYKKLGDSSFENILEGSGNFCYACGRETKSLHHCHITPHALGGSSDDENIFLLCGRCHQDNPDTIFKDLFFDYVKNRNFWLDEIALQTTPIFLRLLRSNPNVGQSVLDKMLSPEFDLPSFMCENSLDKVSAGCNNRMSYETMAGALFYLLSSNAVYDGLTTD